MAVALCVAGSDSRGRAVVVVAASAVVAARGADARVAVAVDEGVTVAA